VKQPELTDAQQERYDQVMRGIASEGLPVSTLLLREDMPAEDRAAVADAFTPGAGKDYH
jgi:hypothetical protein